jgi:predicted GIY-YIG superfamily endonuclease
MYYVYILKSLKDESLYFGSTENLKKRLDEHSTGKSIYSATKKPYTLIWYCAFPSKA